MMFALRRHVLHAPGAGLDDDVAVGEDGAEEEVPRWRGRIRRPNACEEARGVSIHRGTSGFRVRA